MNGFHLIWTHLSVALAATYVSVEIAVVGAIIAWLQLRYAKSRDKKLDIRNSWEQIHKAMLEFRLRREVLNHPEHWWSKEIGGPLFRPSRLCTALKVSWIGLRTRHWSPR